MAGMRRRVSSRRGVLFGAAIAILLSASSVWAQDKVQINFAKAKELNQVKLDARSAPAKVTTEDETALVSKGYVMIGSFVVWQDGKKTAELVQALNSAALAKAAEAGGDLVRFTYKEGTITETEVPTDKVKKVCVETQSVPSSRYYCVPDPGHNSPICRMVDTTVCKKWEQQRQKKKVKALGNSGTVWRYDPKLLAELVERRAATERAEPQQARASGTAAGVSVIISYLSPTDQSLKQLPREDAGIATRVKGPGAADGVIRIPGVESPFRLAGGQDLEFVIQCVDPTKFKLYKFEKIGANRETVVSETRQLSTRIVDPVTVEIAKYGDSSYRFRLKAAEPGEFGFLTDYSVFHFGVDPH